MYEHHFHCPYCTAYISMLLDLSVPGQTYLEDCEVCCNPIEIYYSQEDQELYEFQALMLDQ